jgi:prepilin-type N-terminal cleavage/methylation domain-containing protein
VRKKVKKMLSITKTGRKGFTLIELLVVIAIIAILAAILFPVFARAKAKAQQTVCLNNVKQITFAALMYASDWDDMAPSCLLNWYLNYGRTWTMLLWPYLDPGAWDPNFIQTVRCPSAISIAGWEQDDGPFNGLDYDANGVIFCRDVVGSGGLAFGTGVNMDAIPNPHQIIMFYDSIGANWPWIHIRAYFSPANWGVVGEYHELWQVDTWWSGPHHWGYNCGYADGHAKYAGHGSITPAALGVAGDGLPDLYNDTYTPLW